MQATKPQVQPRTSLLKKKDGTDQVVTKPTVPVKPTIAQKPVINKVQTSPIVSNISNESFKQETPTKSKNVLVVDSISKTSSTKKHVKNKLKISANDLNKLRLQKSLFDMKNVDEKGNYLLYDVREDDEQIKKMDEICELLIAGGYFRARIKGLHNFDKIIGGMCWAIQMCNVNLDIDIFYQESLSIGQKIALTEKVVDVLQKMNCPFEIEPHQIQGMDCIHIFPVIQWLVKKSLETRQQTADYIRSYATWQFNRMFSSVDTLNNSVILNDDKDLANQIVYPIKANLRRRFLHPSRDQLKNEMLRIKTTLLEYGVFNSGASQRVIQGDGKTKPTISIETQNTPDGKMRSSDSDAQSVDHLLDSMTVASESMSENYIKVSSAFVQTLVNEQLSDDTNNYSEMEFNRNEARLKNEILNKKAELNRLLQNNTVDKLNNIQEKLKMLDAKMIEVKESEQNESDSIKKEKLALSELLSALRKQKSELKKHCREERKRIELQIEQLKNDSEKMDKSKFKDKMVEIDRDLSANMDRHETIRKELSTVNKRYALIQRKFDDIPTRTELAQYQKRFLELYNQLSNKHNETKKFYTLYNTLDDERMYLEKEFNLINSIQENFQKAYHLGPMVKEEFLVKFEQTVDSIVQNKNKVEQRLAVERAKRDQLDSEYSDLIEQQRLYFMAVKEFKEECKNNENLLMQLENCS